MATWYKKIMPKVKDVKSYIPKIAEHLKKINNIQDILLWGSISKNYNKPNILIKDIDIIVVSDLFSEDLLSILEDENLFKMNKIELENDGYDPNAVEFTKKLLAFNDYNIDYWAITKDNKLLHWGATTEDLMEWEEVKKEAEDYATIITGSTRKNLNKLNYLTKEKWALMYEHHINKYLSGIPKGWYYSNIEPDIILKDTIRI